MKRLFSFIAFLGMTVAASAVMDLQFVKRWNISGPIPASFTKIVAKPNGGFIAAGVFPQNSDLFLVSLDANANVIAERRWDSPERGQEYLPDLDIDSQGDAIILAGGAGQISTDTLYLVKFDGVTLATEWEIPIQSAQSFGVYRMKRSGVGASEAIYVAGSTSVDMRVFRYSLAGALLGTTPFPHVAEITSLAAVPTAGQGGVAIGGYYGQKPFIGHVNSAGTILVDVQINTMNAGIQDLTTGPSGGIVAVGGPFGGPLTVYRQNSGSSFSPFTRAGYGYGRGVAHQSGNSFVVAAYSGSSNSVATWDSSSGSFGTSYPTGSIGPICASLNGELYAIGPNMSFGSFSPLSGASLPPGETITAAAPYGTDDLLGVGSGVLYSPISGVIASGLTVSGYQERTVSDARPDGQGGVIQLVAPGSGPGHLQRVNAAGNLVWNRSLSAPGVDGQVWIRLSAFGNGDYCVVGRGMGGFVLARVTPAGVVTMVKRVAMPGYGFFHAMDVWVDPQDRIWLGGAVNAGGFFSIIARVNPNGSGLWVMNGGGGSAGWRSLQGQPSGSVMTLLGLTPVQVVRLSSEGVQLNSAPISDSSSGTLDVNALGESVVTGVIGGLVTVTKRDANFANPWTRTIAAATAPLVKFGPNGEVRVAYFSGGTWSLRSYSSAGAVLWTSVVPSSVVSIYDMDVDLSNGWTYLTCGENVSVPSDASVNVVRYLANGIRSAQRKTAGRANLGLQSGASFWALGDVTTRYKAREASSTKWSLP